MRHYPPYKGIDLDWCKATFQTLPKSQDKEKTKERKQSTRIDHSLLREIPKQIETARAKTREDSLEFALFVRDQLLCLWLVFLPWRQKNLRDMTISGTKPNIVKGPIEGTFQKPRWVIDAERANPDAEFWQIRFSSTETKMKHGVEAVVPAPIVPPLELYLSVRNRFLDGVPDPGTLLLTANGKSLISVQVTNLVQTLTLRYAGKAQPARAFWGKERPDVSAQPAYRVGVRVMFRNATCPFSLP